MGVPDENEGSLRKRPRLSLRASNKSEQSKLFPGKIVENKIDTNQSSSVLSKKLDNECVDTMADVPLSPDSVVAPVASLYNLGNTCFLNSVLEVLRYTPGFLDGLSNLHNDIMIQESKRDQEDSSSGSSDLSLNQQIVKNIHSMYMEMSKKEEMHSQIATADASSMAVRPSILLDNIRELNPMFEGHFQHDAQELLRCLLCYIEDAAKENLSWKERKKAKLEEKSPVNQIESNCVDYSYDDSKKIKLEIAESRTSTNDRNSLKGGECGGSFNKALGKLRPETSGFNAHAKNNEKHSTNLLSHTENIKCENYNANSNELKECVKNKHNDQALNVGTSKIREKHETDSHWPTSKTRKRQRSSDPSASNTNPENSRDHEATSCQRLRNRALTPESSNNHTIKRRYKKKGQKETESSNGQLSVESYFQVSSSQSSNCSSQESSLMSNISSPDLTFPKMDDIPQSSKRKRLGLRGRALCQSIIRKSQNVQDIDDNLNYVYDAGNGDINNNKDNFINHKDIDIGSFHRTSSFGCVPIEEYKTKNPVEISEKNYQDITNQKILHESATLFCVERGKHSVAISDISEFRTVSPKKMPLIDCSKISIISENDASGVDSIIDSVTRKYFSSLSKADNTFSSPPSIMSSHAIDSANDSSDEQLSQKLSKKVTCSKYLHVLEPNKEINVKVVVSPKKSAPQHMFSNKLLMSADDKLSSVKSSNSSDTTNVYNSLHKKEKDFVPLPFLNFPDKILQNGQSLLQEPIKLLTAPCKSIVSFLNKIQNSVSLKSNTSTQTESSFFGHSLNSTLLNISTEQMTSFCHRSTGTVSCKCADSFKVHLKKCNYLGISPVKSRSALKAQLNIQQDRMLKSRARRSLFKDADNDCYNTCKISDHHHMQSDLTQILVSQNLLKEDGYRLLSECSNKNERRFIIEALTSSPTKTMCNINSGADRISDFTRKSPRKHQEARKSSQLLSGSSQMMITKYFSIPSRNIIPLKSLSVSLENCDQLLKAAKGKPISARKALLDIKNGRKVVLKSTKIGTEAANKDKETGIKNMGIFVADNKSQTNPHNMIERLFGGTMVHQTKCLECETARQRQEVFMDISVPVRNLHSRDNCHSDSSDDDSGDEIKTQDRTDGMCLSKLIQAFSNVERLMGPNKYFCDHCVHHVEAERSCHYLTLPTVLTLHLKRFSANSRTFGGVAKLTDKVIIPQSLPCLHYQCVTRCSATSHRYSLFAIITHSGTSILHGHYRAYVKVQPEVNKSVFQNIMKSKFKGYENQHHAADDKMSCSPLSDLTNNLFPDSISSSENNHISKSLTNGECDGAKNMEQKVSISGRVSKNKNQGNRNNNLRGNTNVKPELLSTHSNVEQSFTSPANNFNSSSADENKSKPTRWVDEGDLECIKSFWLECDDECIKVMDETEFVEKLEERDGQLIGTPYVLFYHKVQT